MVATHKAPKRSQKPFKRLFLDDMRTPRDCVHYMAIRIGDKVEHYLEEWKTVRTKGEFINYVMEQGVPDLVSLDHDVVENFGESDQLVSEDGYACLKWLINHCIENQYDVPEVLFHTMNVPGMKNMQALYNKFRQSL